MVSPAGLHTTVRLIRAAELERSAISPLEVCGAEPASLETPARDGVAARRNPDEVHWGGKNKAAPPISNRLLSIETPSIIKLLV